MEDFSCNENRCFNISMFLSLPRTTLDKNLVVLMSLETYLSEYVYEIIVKYSETSSHCRENDTVHPDITYDWGKIGNLIGETDEFNILDQPGSWYLTKAQVVWDVVHTAATAFKAASSCQRANLYQLCQKLCSHIDVAYYCNLSESERDVGTLLAVLSLSSALERALGNLYLMMNQPVPFLLRDLLRTSELNSLFGKTPIVFMQLLLGSPKGLNLRNVAWHGFVSPGELHSHLVPGIIVLFASLGKILSTDEVIQKIRPQFSSFDKFQAQLSQVYPDVSNKEKEVLALLDSSPYIPEKCRLYWRKSYEFYQRKRFGDSLVLLLPQLEHCLRIVYCQVNDCSSHLLTAESTVVYKTLDEILAPSTCLVVGKGLTMMLLDLTSSLSGPRLRDRISHGECELSLIPQWLLNHVFCIGLSVALSQHHATKGLACCSQPLCSALQKACLQYRSCFHVSANLQHSMCKLLDQWTGRLPCPRPPDISVEPLACQNISALDHMLFPQAVNPAQKLQNVKKALKSYDSLTLYRPRAELGMAACLLSVIEKVSLTTDKLQQAVSAQYQLWCDRTLRSRARATYLRMLAVLPDLWTCLLCVVMLIILCQKYIPKLAEDGKTLRFVKCLLKATENIVSQCDSSRNRWTEAHLTLSIMSGAAIKWLQDTHNLVPLTSLNKS